MAGQYAAHVTTLKQLTSVADEPRRSGRASKGQHTKNKDDSDSATKKGKAAKGKKGKTEPEPEEDEEDDAYIRCVCGQYDPDEDGRPMIACDKCDAWQHNDCMGLPDDYSPKQYFCEQCKPSGHRELLAAIQRGEKPWLDAQIRREQQEQEKESKKKVKKGGRRSAARTSDVTATRTPTAEPEELLSSKKRKADDSPTPAANQKVSLKSPDGRVLLTLSQVKRARSSLREESTNGPDEEPEPVVEDENQDVMEEDAIFVDVAKDPKDLGDSTRSRLATSLVNTFVDQASSLLKSKTISLGKGESVQSLGTQIGLYVEHAVYHARAESGEAGDAYKDQVRSILSNVKYNPDLSRRLMSRQLRPDELATMDPRDMASDEQKQRDLKEKERMEKQHVLVNQESGPRVRKTHKGDEYVDGDEPETQGPGPAAAPVKQETPQPKVEDTDMKSPVTTDKPAVMRKPSAATKGSLFNKPRRQSSTNFDIDKVFSGVGASPVNTEAPKPLAPGQSSSTAIHDSQPDADVDRLLKDEDDNESAPYSPKEFVEDGVVWRGRIDGGNLGTFSTVARFAAGCQPDAENLQMTWSQVIPPVIKLHGRIQPNKADEYLCGLEYSSTTELIIVNLAEPKEPGEKEEFDRFFKYLKGKERYGVGSQHLDPAVKDIYFLPMDVGQALPTVMRALDHNLVDPVTERSLLLPIVIKWTELPQMAERAKDMRRQSEQVASQSPAQNLPVAQTPITPQVHQSQFDGPPAPYAAVPPPPAGINGGPLSTTAYSVPPTGAPSSAQQPLQPTQGVPQAHPLQQNPAPAAQHALKVLGPEMAAAPSIVELVARAPNTGEKEFDALKECITENPEAGRSLAVLTQMLQVKYQNQRSSQQPPG